MRIYLYLFNINRTSRKSMNNKKIYTVKLLCSWDENLAKSYEYMVPSDSNIKYVSGKNMRGDYYVIINVPLPNDYYDPSKTIVLYMEPSTWLNDFPTNKEDFLKVIPHQIGYNNTEWHIKKDIDTLRVENINKTKQLSVVLSNAYCSIGHKLRVDFIRYIEDKIDIDIYGRCGPLGYKKFIKELPHLDKIDGLYPYQYTIAVENNSEYNYFTEKINDSIVSECLCFYWGAPNVEEYFPNAFIRLDLTNFDIALQQIKTAIENNEWEKRLPAIKKAKHKILYEMHMTKRIENIIKETEIETKMIYEIPNNFELPSFKNRYLFFDMFIKNNNLILVSTYYTNITLDFTNVAISVNGKLLSSLSCCDSGDDYEPIRHISYILPNELHNLEQYNVNVMYQNKHKEYDIKPINIVKKHKLVMATLFKDDYDFIPTVYKFYKKQGVDHFYFYYNGKISDIQDKLFKSNDIHYGEWNYDYWIDLPKLRHHAQMTFLTMFRYKYMSLSDFNIMNDLDELIFTENNISLYEHLKMSKEMVHTIRSYWAKIVSNDDNKLEIIINNESLGWINRTKCIYSGKYDGSISIHHPRFLDQASLKNDSKIYNDTNLKMAHISHLTNPARIDEVTNKSNKFIFYLNSRHLNYVSTMPQIILRPTGGLCNKLRLMFSWYEYYKTQNTAMTVIWDVEEDCPGYFLDYFNNINGITFIKSNFGLSYDVRYDATDWRKHPSYYDGLDPIIWNRNKLLITKGNRSYIYNDLQLTDRMIKLVNDTKAQLPTEYIALHVRRTDHLTYAPERYRYTSDDEFFEFIDDHDENLKIYLATDNSDTQNMFKKKYGDRIVVHHDIPKPKQNSTQRMTTLEDAIIDIYVCIGAKFFKESSCTSFSEVILEHRENISNMTKKSLYDMKFYDQNDNLINNQNIEKIEQDLANEYIQENDCVLELGARYGTVSCVINNRLKNKKKQVVVEPDNRVWDALEKNRDRNNCDFNIVKGFLSDRRLNLTNLNVHLNGYGSTSIEDLDGKSMIPSYSMNEIKTMYNIKKFNVLVADCEGFLETFFDENPDFYDNLRLIIFEADYGEKCNYKKIRNKLREKGLKPLLEGHQNVWLR